MKVSRFHCSVDSVDWVTKTVFEVRFRPEIELSFKPGQFCSVIIPGAGKEGRDLRRAYSIASPPKRRPVELCVKLVPDGPGTSFLSQLKPGDRFEALAPYGRFVYLEKPNRHACFVSTGTGISPFYSMIFSEEYEQTPPLSAKCIFGTRSEDELLYSEAIGNRRDVDWVPCVSRPESDWKGFRGRVTDYLRSLDHFPWKETDFYLCGNSAMIKEVKEILLSKEVEKTSIHQEAYF